MRAAVFAAITFTFFTLGYEEADEAGIRFRRYFSLHRTRWERVQTAEWGGISGLNYMTLTVQDKQGLSQQVEFVVINDFRQLAKAFSRGEPPEIVSWVMRQTAIPRGIS